MRAVRLAIRRLLVLAACMLALGASASAYYHFLHFAGRTGPFTPIPEKLDLAALPNRTLQYYVSAAGPAKMADGDSFAAVLSELRLAGQAWNGIETSDLRVAFGGLGEPNTPQSTPHIDVVFSNDIPPGVLAEGGPTSRTDIVDSPDGAYVPIVRSEVRLRSDLSNWRSSSSGFFLTAVHELGHALGLQHTFTSSVMSTDATRASTKASPLGADDAAAISLLYPNAKFAARYGSISGRVTMSGDGVHLASVVALASYGQAVSALTNPDGTYRIDGLRPGDYYIYVHALPPSMQPDLGSAGGPADIVLPVDADGKTFPAGDSFRTEFYPGTQDLHQATTIGVKAGEKSADINFAVERSGAPGLYGVTTYSFPGKIAVKPAYINLNQQVRPVMVAWGTGLMNGDEPAPGLSVAMLGGTNAAPGGVRPYSADNSFLQVNFMFTPFSGRGPRHVVFSTQNDVYVLPSAVTLVNRQPPSIASAAGGADGNGNRIVTISGSDLGPDTRILFDGVPAAILSVDDAQDRIVVAPPPAPVNYQARIVALNSDGQASLFLADPVVYTYDLGPADAASISLSSNAQSAGTEAMIEIAATNMTFAEGETWVGFGSSDVVVKAVWLVSPAVLRANVFVVPGAQASDTLVSVTSGFQTASLPAGFHVRTGSSVPAIGSDVVNADPAQSGVYPGSTAILPVYNLPSTIKVSSLTLTLNGIKAPIASLDQNKLTFQVPASVKPGPVVVNLGTGGDPISPVFVFIQPVPPVIQSVSVGGTIVNGDHPAHPGDALAIQVVNLGDAGVTVPRERLRLVIGGIEHPISEPATPLEDRPGVHEIRTTLSPMVDASDQVPVVVSIDGRSSTPVLIAVTK